MVNVALRVAAIGCAVALAARPGVVMADEPRGRVAVTVWAARDDAHAQVIHRRQVEVAADGTLEFPGVAANLDAETAMVRSLTEPGATVIEQRVLGDRGEPEALLAQQVGKPLTAILARGEIHGVLRSVSSAYLGIETDGPAGKQLELVRNGDQILGLRFAATGVATEPTLLWRLQGARPGRHDVEVSYQTSGLDWVPSYTAVIDGDTVDLGAWATIVALGQVRFDGAELT